MRALVRRAQQSLLQSMEVLMRMRNVIFLLVASACSRGQQVDGQVFSQTIVTLRGSGEPIVTTRTITAAEQQAQIEARRRLLESRSRTPGVISQAISQDPGCGDASLLLFDGTSLHGNEICFFGAGSVWLHNYLRGTGSPPDLADPHHLQDNVPVGNWAEAVRSYFPGDEDGIFWGPALPHRGRCHTDFAGFGDTFPSPVDVADGCVMSAVRVQLTD
jgi:hypothetical protein